MAKESEVKDKYRRRQRRPWQGLVHISQLSATRVERVEDVIDIDEKVWVKVLEVERQDMNLESRYRIKLSMKEVSQDGTRLDLQREDEAKKKVVNQLETSLNSMIGMGVARDPMERLVLKSASRNGNMASTKTVFRGGYTLVDDNEGEPESISSAAVPDARNSEYRTAPMGRGRGRGATLPAWMTHTKGPVGMSSDAKKIEESTNENAHEHEIHDDVFEDNSSRGDSGRQRSLSKSEKKKDRKRRRKKKRRDEHRHRHRDRDHRDGYSSDTSNSRSSRNYGQKRRQKKHHKSRCHLREEVREERRSFSKRKKDKKKLKSSRCKQSYEEVNDRSHRAKRHYKSEESSSQNRDSDSNSRASFR